jgi:hypothetical protein
MKSFGVISKNPGCWLTLAKGLVLLVVLYLFRYEIGLLWRLILAAPKLLLDQPVSGLPPADDMLFQLMFIAFNLAGIMLFSLLIVYLIAGAVFPIRLPSEQWQAMRRFFRFVTGRRPSVLLVREGQLVGELPRKQKSGGGAAIIDLDSAIVLERQSTTSAASQTLGAENAPGDLALGLQMPLSTMQNDQRSKKENGPVRGPGLTFLRGNHKLRGVVSLRRQARANPGILGYTSDGIEVKTNVVAVFSLGQPASNITVAYLGAPVFENLRVLNLDPETKKIKSISEELDDADKQDIHRFAWKYLSAPQPNAPLEPPDTSQEYPPYHIDARRIFAAVYSQARHATESKLDDWTSLPALVATEIFRNMISQVSYDSLYLPDDPVRFPLQTDFKPAFARKVRYQGVMSYQFVHRLDGQSPAEGQRVDNRQYRIAPVKELYASKVLRDRGIKVLHAGFSELTPTDPKIRQQRLDNWRARWQQEADLIKADLDLEAVRIKNHARAEKQREMINTLSMIIHTSTYPEEALTLRVFQALEDIASEPPTRQLLPVDTIQVLKSLRLWLLPGEQERPALLEGQFSSPADERPAPEQDHG